EQAGLSNAAEVTVETDRGQVRARLRLAPEVRPGVCVLPEGLPAARALVSSELDPDHHRVVASPRPVTVSE
ncbi:MAG: molybdopterin dinucleotide binding domain-containing protein, partial [Planctomycetota bacterium]